MTLTNPSNPPRINLLNGANGVNVDVVLPASGITSRIFCNIEAVFPSTCIFLTTSTLSSSPGFTSLTYFPSSVKSLLIDLTLSSGISIPLSCSLMELENSVIAFAYSFGIFCISV